MRTRCIALLVATLLLSPGISPAQDNFGDLFNLDDSLLTKPAAEPTVEAQLAPTGEEHVVALTVTLTVPPESNTYSQQTEGAKPTKITVTPPEGWVPVDEAFVPDHPPKTAFDELFQATVEKFVGSVTFARRYRVPAGTDPVGMKVTGKINFLLCDANSCAPKTLEFATTWSDELASLPALAEKSDMPDAEPAGTETVATARPITGGYRLPKVARKPGEAPDPIQLQFVLDPATAAPGEEVKLHISMSIADNWRTYGIDPAPDQFETPTAIQYSELRALEPVGKIASTPKPTLHKSEIGVSNAHEGQVTWTQTFRVTEDGTPGLQGTIKYQLCEGEARCLPPHRVAFSLGSLQRAEDITTAQPIAVSEPIAPTDDSVVQKPAAPAADEADTLFAVQDDEQKIQSLAVAVPLAFLGGLILNVMPCVLPVLAIKILSLVQQAGESRMRVLSLNFAYTLGVLSVFLTLAALASVFSLGWGQQFQSVEFNIAMIGVVFAMGLSLLGVFELPVPGLMPSANSHQEGMAGAFSTGIIATLLATPCTGPFMVPVFTYTLQQSPAIIFLLFGVMGLGMASPYVLAGFFPALVNWLPKPGMWMVRFKQFTGFVLMGTVIWLMTSLVPSLVVPTLIFLLGLALFFWMVGNLYNTVSPQVVKWRVRIAAVALAAPLVYLGLSPIFEMSQAELAAASSDATPGAHRSDDELPWEAFSEERMISLRKEGVPMLIDFTANWCGICKYNEYTALNTTATIEFVNEHGIIPLMADYTLEDAEIRKWLNKFGQDSVPLTIIMPPSTDVPPIALRGQYSQAKLLEKLEEAMQAAGATQTALKQTATR